jgi:hypothetical protein
MTSEAFLVTLDNAAKRANIQINRIVHTAFDTFEINETRWKVRFQSWPRKPQEGDPILELADDFPEVEPRFEQDDFPKWFANLPLEQRLAQMEIHEEHRRAVRQDTAGWHLRRRDGCVEGWLDLAKLPKNKQKKPFASFDVSESGTIYRCQLHVWELPFAPGKPTAWDNRRGASAGIPSLGKRR